MDRTWINNYWCIGHHAPYVALPEASLKFASKEAQRATHDRRDFRDAVRVKRNETGASINNACELVIFDWCKEKQLAMCCILGDDVMLTIYQQARERA